MSSETLIGADDRPLSKRLRAYGCPDLIPLDQPLTTPAQIEYLDLLPRRGSSSPPLVAGVAEHQGTALLYVLDASGEAMADAAKIAKLQHQLANRSDPAWLGVARPGSLDLYPIGFHETAVTTPAQAIAENSPAAPLFFQSLVHAAFSEGESIKGADYVFKKIYGLLTQTTDRYVGEGSGGQALKPLDVLSMAGRALFFRFLVDRRIVLDSELEEVCPAADGLKDTFASAEKAAYTSAWLDETFNGDFLLLIDESIPATDRAARQQAYLTFYRRIGRRVGSGFFDHLHAILNGWRAIGGGIQQELDWGDLDFAHIPVGVLSQVYESFSRRADPHTALETSVHYTPRTIARLMVDQAFAAVKDPARAMVLDPACGAGIFLVLSLRRLVSERWRVDQKRPDTRTIQSTLYGQLRGFDVSEPALRLAALALYITAIELNGTQRPPKALRFPRDLREGVLFYLGDDPEQPRTNDSESERATFSLGSLGPRAPVELNGLFDIVIGNPPWKRLREGKAQSTGRRGGRKRGAETAALNEEFTKIGQRALRERGLADLAEGYENPDKNPDLPFLWRATEWAKKEDGIIALALPARFFGRLTGNGHFAWKAVLRSIAVTGLLNGADLRWSKVWEGVKIPFCLLFARNAVPPLEHRFTFAAPLHEPALNRQSRFRLDYEAAKPISVQRVERQPWVLKTLSLGTWRDVEVVETLLQAFDQNLGEFWRAWNPVGDKTGKGFDDSPGLAQKKAPFLGDLRVFIQPGKGLVLATQELETFFEKYRKRSAHMPRTENLYKPPLVIIPQSLGEDPLLPKAFLSSHSLAFSQSFYGYSCKGHPDAKALAALLFLVVHSTLFRYFISMISVAQGANRLIFTKQDLDALPFPDLARLPTSKKASLISLADRARISVETPLTEIDEVIFRLFGLDDVAIQTIHDTLFSSAVYRIRGRVALERTRRADREPFRRELGELLEPYFDVCGEKVSVAEPLEQPDRWQQQPWYFLALSRAGDSVSVNSALLQQAMEQANQRSASRIFVRASGKGGLLLGLLNQRRWWTITRARLCSQAIVREHLDAFGLAERA